MKLLQCLSLLCSVFLLSCEERPLQAVGQLESDRIELVAEFSETIISINAREGDELSATSILLQQDTSRIDIRIEEALANVAQLDAVLAEQLSGARVETIDAAMANLKLAEIERNFSATELERLLGLRARDLTSIDSVDRAQKSLESSRAGIEFVQAQLAELEAGTRPEQIEQTRGRQRQALAQLAGLELDKRRHSVLVPTASIVDSLPFEVGERPRQGDVVAVMLSGAQPYARVYIPESVRVRITPGVQLQIHIDGLDGTLTATVRRISAEASFTPYFALTETDRGRLSYVAELSLPALPSRLPDGVPVQVFFE